MKNSYYQINQPLHIKKMEIKTTGEITRQFREDCFNDLKPITIWSKLESKKWVAVDDIYKKIQSIHLNAHDYKHYNYLLLELLKELK